MKIKSVKTPTFGDVEEWKAPTNYISSNYFSEFSPINWESCRERFSVKMRKKGFKGFFFAHVKDRGENVAHFVHKTELLLRIPDSDMTTYNKTSVNMILKVNMSDFWLSSYVRRSLFTLLVRLGQYYDIKKDNYEECLLRPTTSPASGYLNTVPAVKKFLCGNTVYKENDPNYSGSGIETAGWCHLFSRPESFKKLGKDQAKDDSVIAEKISEEKICG